MTEIRDEEIHILEGQFELGAADARKIPVRKFHAAIQGNEFELRRWPGTRTPGVWFPADWPLRAGYQERIALAVLEKE